MLEEECVLLKEANIEDPLADPFQEELSEDVFEYDKIQNNVPSESENNELSDESSTKLKSDLDTNKEQELPEVCDICLRRFKSIPGLRSHKHNIHNPNKKIKRKKYKKNNYTEKQFKCKICVYCSLRQSNFLTHMKKHQRHEEKFLTSEEFQIRCDLCLAPLKNAKKLSQHMKIVHPKEKCRCGVCFEKFKALSTLKRHLRNFHPEEAPIFLKELDDKLEKERAIRKESQPERQKQRKAERKQLRSAQKEERKILSKMKKIEQIKLSIIDKINQEKLAKLEQVKQSRLAREKRRNNKNLITIKEEPEEFKHVRVSRRNDLKEIEVQKVKIEIKQEPEIEINEIVSESLS